MCRLPGASDSSSVHQANIMLPAMTHRRPRRLIFSDTVILPNAFSVWSACMHQARSALHAATAGHTHITLDGTEQVAMPRLLSPPAGGLSNGSFSSKRLLAVNIVPYLE